MSNNDTCTVLLKARCVDEWTDLVDFATLEVRRSWLQDLRLKLDLASRLKKETPELSSLTFWDSAQFRGLRQLEEPLQESEKVDEVWERLQEEECLVLESNPLEDVEPVRTECVELTVMETGIYWSAYLKGTGIRIETTWLDGDTLDRLAGQSDFWGSPSGSAQKDSQPESSAMKGLTENLALFGARAPGVRGATRGARTSSHPRRGSASDARTTPNIPVGWGVFNTGTNGLGPDEVEVQRFDGFDPIFPSDELAAEVHFEEWELRMICGRDLVVGRGPKTPEARRQVEIHNAHLRELEGGASCSA